MISFEPGSRLQIIFDRNNIQWNMLLSVEIFLSFFKPYFLNSYLLESMSYSFLCLKCLAKLLAQNKHSVKVSCVYVKLNDEKSSDWR